MKNVIPNIKVIYLILIIGLTLLFSLSAIWNISREQETAHDYAKIEAQASFDKDILYRKWVSMHGGVYAPATEVTQPNPHLSFNKERDITTSSGKKLTLINPAYMTRQVFELAEEQYGVKGHITSLKPIRAENKADEWETETLQEFEKGIDEIFSIEKIKGAEYIRYMHVLKVEKNCLKCHARQNYKLGDVRGGISVSVPMDKYYTTYKSEVKNHIFTHLIVYLIIIIISIPIFRIYNNEIKKRRLMQKKIINNEAFLQIQNKEYLLLNEEYKKQNIELTKAKEKAEESDRLKTAFLQNVSHEIRTPMNAIVGFAELLPKNFDNKEKLENFSGIINQRCSDLLDIINDLLDIAKIESGQLPVNVEKVNLSDLFNELKTFFIEFQARLNKPQIYFDMQANCELRGISISTDKVKLKQIFINLISNAFKFTEKGKIIGGCKIEDSDKLIFYVTDTGIGIPQDKFEYIFERFSQIQQNEAKLNRGTGLGLPIVKGLVNLLGGKIWLKSEPGKGSTFYFTINYHNFIKEEESNIKEEIDVSLFRFKSNKVLIVEDDPYNLDLIKEFLQITCLDLYFSENGEDAIKKTVQIEPDIMLLDIGLPDISGYEVISKVLMINPKIKIIAQTAYASIDDRNRLLNAGCVDYISKPIKANELLNIILKNQ